MTRKISHNNCSLAGCLVSGERQRASQVLYRKILYIEIRSWLSNKYTNIHKWPPHFLWPMNAQSCYASHWQGFITIPSVLKKTPTLFWIKDTFLLTLERRHFLPQPITRDRVFQNRPFHSERPAAYCRKSHSCYRHQGKLSKWARARAVSVWYLDLHY